MQSSEKLEINKRKSRNIFQLISVCILLLEFRLLLIYDLPTNDWLIFMGSVISVVFIIVRRTRLHVAGWWLFIYLVCSFLIVSSYKFVTSMSTSSVSIHERNFASMASATISIFFVFFVAVLVLYIKRDYHKSSDVNNVPYIRIHYKVLFILAVLFSIISHILGIGKMGAETYALPFHLSGVLQFYRAELFPLLALIEYSNIKYYHHSDKNKLKVFLGSYTIWALYECLLRLSKSALVTSFLPIIIFEIIVYRKNNLSFIKKIAPIILLTLLLFLVMPILRDSDGGVNSKEIAESSNKELLGGSNKTSVLVFPYTRMFYSGYLYLVDDDYVDDNTLFDFSKAPIILTTGGSAQYQTIVIDEYPEENHHSSGSSPFIDSFLLGGYGLLYITVFLFALFAHNIDKRIFRDDNKIIVAIICTLFYRLFDMLSFSVIVDLNMIKWLCIYIGVLIFVHYQAKSFSSSKKVII